MAISFLSRYERGTPSIEISNLAAGAFPIAVIYPTPPPSRASPPGAAGFLIALAHVLASSLDLLRLFLIDLGEFISGVTERMQYFIQLRVDGLSVAMLGALNNERHGPRCQGGSSVPPEEFPA
jgi:hypothetical protein